MGSRSSAVLPTLLGAAMLLATGCGADETRGDLQPREPTLCDELGELLEEEVPGGVDGVAHGYFVSDDWTEFLSPSVGFGAGAMLSNGPDLVRWLDALLNGEVLSEASKLEMKTPTELPGGSLVDYGLGLDLRSWGDGYGNVQGHTGDAIIYRAEAFHLPERDVTVVVLLNGFPYEP